MKEIYSGEAKQKRREFETETIAIERVWQHMIVKFEYKFCIFHCNHVL